MDCSSKSISPIIIRYLFCFQFISFFFFFFFIFLFTGITSFKKMSWPCGRVQRKFAFISNRLLILLLLLYVLLSCQCVVIPSFLLFCVLVSSINWYTSIHQSFWCNIMSKSWSCSSFSSSKRMVGSKVFWIQRKEKEREKEKRKKKHVSSS